MNRNQFMKAGLSSALTLGLLPIANSAFSQDDPAPLKGSLVKEFVTAGHSDLNRVKEMLADHPNLIYSRHDWGNGDFEEAIEGAGHLGNQEIANYLIGQGARVNLFVLTMLGKKDLVVPVIETYPELVYAKGAHGFTFLHHSKVGGENAKELFDYFRDKGLIETHIKIR